MHLWSVRDPTFLIVACLALPLLCRYKVGDVGVVALVGERVLAPHLLLEHRLLNLK